MEDGDPHRFNYHETPMDGETLKNSITRMMVARTEGVKQHQRKKATRHRTDGRLTTEIITIFPI